MTVMDTIKSLSLYIHKQLSVFFPMDGSEPSISNELIEHALYKTVTNIRLLKTPVNSGQFDRFVSWHYCQLIYRLSRILSEHDKMTANRIFLLNKLLNGIDLYFEVELPDTYLIAHTVGAVFSKAIYGNCCVFHQGCTVGRNDNGAPNIGYGTVMFPHSAIIGSCNIGQNTVISAGVNIIDCDTPGDCIVFSGQNGKPVFKPIHNLFVERYFNI
jgi:serine O-acetyltransferase